MPADATPKGTHRIAALGVCAAALLYVFPHFPRINNPNENVRVYMTAAIVEEGTYRIDALRARWGWVNDAAVHDGHYYSVKAPGTSLLGVPGYALYQAVRGDRFDRAEVLWVLRVTATVLPMLGFFLALYFWYGRQTRFALVRDTVAFSIVFGSLLYGYSLLFVSHALSAASAFGAFMVLFGARRSGYVSMGQAALGGALTAGVTFFEYPGFVASVVLSLYALVAIRPWKRLVPFALGALPPTLLVMHFQWSAFGSPFTPGHLMVENAAFRAGHESGFYGADAFHGEAALALLFDRRWGLFSLTPVLFLSVVGLGHLLRRRKSRVDAGFALAVCLLTYLLICTMNNWTGGWSIGPRYLAVIVPFMGFFALVGLDRITRRSTVLGGALGFGTALAALIASGIASVYYPHLPPAIRHPLPHLYALLIAHDFAPFTAANLLSVFGTASMVPLYLLLLGALFAAVIPHLAGWRRVVALVLGGAVGVGALLPLTWPAPRSPQAADAVAFVTRTFTPEGHDRAARLEALLKAAPDADPDVYRSLADTYFEEGRVPRAKATIRRLERRPK